jgi:hypothetical protein
MKESLLYAGFVMVAVSSNSAGQTVVVDDNIGFAAPDSFSASHRGSIQQAATGDDVTSVWFDYDGSSLTAVAWNPDEESDWYVANPGDAFGFATVAKGQFTPIFTVDNPRPQVFVGSKEFYLAVSTTSTDEVGIREPFCDSNDPVCRKVFGWLRLRNVRGQLEMVENAVAYGSLGILVGTTELVPEPSCILLVGLGFCGWSACCRNRMLVSRR